MRAYLVSLTMERVGSKCTAFAYQWCPIEHECKWDWVLGIAENVGRGVLVRYVGIPFYLLRGFPH